MMSFSLSGGVEVFGFISPSEPTDQYPVIDPLYGIDGFRNVDLLSDLNNIPNLRRRAGMVVGISGGTDYYKLNLPPWNGTLTDWSLFTPGSFTGGTITGGTVFLDGLTATTLSASTYLNLPLDLTITGFSYSNNTFTLTNSSGQTLTSSFNDVTGLTVNGDLSVTGNTNLQTVSAATYLNLPLDIFVTGGTYSNGSATFTNNTGGTFNVNGFYTGQTSYVNSLTTGVGLSADTTTGNINIINTDPDQVVNINSGSNIDVTGSYPNFTISVTGLTDNNTFITGFTYDNLNTFLLSDNSGNTYSATIDNVSGLTVNGDLNVTGNTTFDNLTATTISATTYQNLPLDVFVTGGTFSSGVITFTNNSGGTFGVSGISSFDTVVTGFTYSNNTFTISQNSGTPLNATINVVTGLTVNGNLTVTGTSNLNGSIVSTNLSGSTDRIVQVNSGGTFSATQQIISAYITSGGTAANNLENTSNWDINGDYIGPAITGTFQGQKHYDGNYFYEAVLDNVFIRLIRG